jgi:hypothetical protein
MTVGTGELLKLIGDYHLLCKNEHAWRTRVPIKTNWCLRYREHSEPSKCQSKQMPLSRIFRKVRNEGQLKNQSS